MPTAHPTRIERPAEVEQGIATAFAHDAPVLIDAVAARSELAQANTPAVDNPVRADATIEASGAPGRSD